jgi:hypothetical protein
MTETIEQIKAAVADMTAIYSEIASVDFNSTRGKLSDALRKFAMDGKLSMYVQQYNRANEQNIKIPFIFEENILGAMVWVRMKCKNIIKKVGPVYGTGEVARIVKAFQHYLVAQHIIAEAKDPNSNFDALWTRGGISLSNLKQNPTKYHERWVWFFTHEGKTSIDKLMRELVVVISYRRKMQNAINRYLCATGDSDTVEQHLDTELKVLDVKNAVMSFYPQEEPDEDDEDDEEEHNGEEENKKRKFEINGEDVERAVKQRLETEVTQPVSVYEELPFDLDV